MTKLEAKILTPTSSRWACCALRRCFKESNAFIPGVRASSYDILRSFSGSSSNFKKLWLVIFARLQVSQRIPSQKYFFSKFFFFFLFWANQAPIPLRKDRKWIVEAFSSKKSRGKCKFWLQGEKHNFFKFHWLSKKDLVTSLVLTNFLDHGQT